MASGGQRAAESSAGRRVAAIEDDEITPYVITNEIGKGSFATVYRGYHQDTRAAVAIKTVSRTILTPKLIDNLESEINILKQLKHKHITQLIDILKVERFIFLIMEDCTGGDLAGYLKRRGRVEGLQYIPSPGQAPIYYPHSRSGGLDIVVVRSFLRQLARALKFLRQRNLIHRDIKPQNLLLTPPSQSDLEKGHPLGVPVLKLADFGFARFLPNQMMADTLCGSPLYMAPEILGYKQYDVKADLWSVGVVLYEMSVGKPPFRAQNHIELLKKIEMAKSTVRFPDEDDTSGRTDIQPVPADIKQLIRSLLKLEPVNRASFEDFFGSKAVANSKFPVPGTAPSEQPGARPSLTANGSSNVTIPNIPPGHRIIPPEVLDPKANIPPSTFNFRRPQVTNRSSSGKAVSSRSSRDALRTTSTNGHGPSPSASPPIKPSPLPPQKARIPELTSTIGGENDEDGFLRREYVLVGDTREIEFNRQVEEINAARRRRRESMTPDTGTAVHTRAAIGGHGYSPNSSPRGGTVPLSASPKGLSGFGFPPQTGHAQGSDTESNASSHRPGAKRAASSALTRALNMASKKLFGAGGTPRLNSAYVGSASASNSPVSGTPPQVGREVMGYPPILGSPPGSPKMRPQILPTNTGVGHEAEEALLTRMEDCAQKAHVITRWADELFETVRAVPQKPIPDPSKFTPRDGEPPRQAMKRRNADLDVQLAAINCASLYVLVMTFAQNGLQELKEYMDALDRIEQSGVGIGVSEGYDIALDWFATLFEGCNEKARTLRSWLPDGGGVVSEMQLKYLDQLLFERALFLSRGAARKEILDQQTWECEDMYEDALWLLYTVRDELLPQREHDWQVEDREKLQTWITRTKLRHHRCHARGLMDEQARRQDAQADWNLVDANRVPHPWEHQPLPPEV